MKNKFQERDYIYMQIQHSGKGGFLGDSQGRGYRSTYSIPQISRRPGYEKHFPYFLRTLGREIEGILGGVERY